MISKGTTHNNGVRLAKYMITGKDGERAELWQLRGFEATNITDGFRDVQIMAKATKCQQPFFHVQVRNREGEQLTPEQWEQTADRIEKMLGLTGQPRAISFHTFENGDSHMHVAWSRIREDDLAAIPLPFFKRRLKKLSRELELEFVLEPVTNRRPDEIRFAPTRAEEEQARRLGLDVHEIRNTIRSCYERSDCGRSFQAALEHEDLILARGDQRDFLVIDREGGMHALGKRVLDVSAVKVRDRLSDLSRDSLPTVGMVRDALRVRAAEQSKREERPARVWDRDRTDREWFDAVVDASIARDRIEREFQTRGRKGRELNDVLPTRRGVEGETNSLTNALRTEEQDRSKSTLDPTFKRPGRAGKGALRSLAKTLDTIGGAVESLFAPVASPEQLREAELTRRRRDAEAENAMELARYMTELARQREEAERRKTLEREGGGRER